MLIENDGNMHLSIYRPLPRGLLRFEEAKTAVNLTQLGLIVYGILLAVRFSWSVGLLFILQVRSSQPHSFLCDNNEKSANFCG